MCDVMMSMKYVHKIWPEVKCFLINVISDIFNILKNFKTFHTTILCNFKGTFYLFRNSIIDAMQKNPIRLSKF